MIEGFVIGEENSDFSEEELNNVDLDYELGEIQDETWDDEVKGDHEVDE